MLLKVPSDIFKNTNKKNDELDVINKDDTLLLKDISKGMRAI